MKTVKRPPFSLSFLTPDDFFGLFESNLLLLSHLFRSLIVVHDNTHLKHMGDPEHIKVCSHAVGDYIIIQQFTQNGLLDIGQILFPFFRRHAHERRELIHGLD